MPDTDIGSAVASDLKSVKKPYNVDSQSIDGAEDIEETRWPIVDFEKNLC